MANRVILFLDGEEPNAVLVKRNLQDVSLAVATDGATTYTMQHAIRLDAIVGDMDSLTEVASVFYRDQGTEIISRPEQNANDFEKALRYIASTVTDARIRVFGIHGKRTDHVLTNFSVLQRYTDRFEEIVAYDETFRHHFLTTAKNSASLDLPYDALVSLTPLPRAEGVTTQGLRYPLSAATMVFGEREGLSNRVNSQNGATVTLTSGALLISYMF